MVFHLSRTSKNEDFDDLYKALKKIDQKEMAFEAFTKYEKKAGDYLVNKLPVEKDNLTKSDVIQIIGLVGCTDCEEKLIPFLEDTDWRIRFFTIDTLDKLKYQNISDLLPNIITKDNSRSVKIKAIVTLGKHGSAKDSIFLDYLSKLNEYQDKKLRRAIDMALSELKSGAHTKGSDRNIQQGGR